MMRFNPDADNTLYDLFGPVTDDPAERLALMIVWAAFALALGTLAAGVVALLADGPTLAATLVTLGALVALYLAANAEVQ